MVVLNIDLDGKMVVAMLQQAGVPDDSILASTTCVCGVLLPNDALFMFV